MQLHFKELGRGEPLIMLHGLFGSGDNWLGVAPKLAEKFHVYLLDLRNHGQSPHGETMDYPLMAGDVARFLDEHELKRANLLGHSMGGKVAMQFALDFPERVNKLIVADMAPRLYEPEHNEIFDALLALDLKSYHSRKEMEEALAPKIPDLVLRRFLLKNLGHRPDGSYFWKMNLSAIHENYLKLGEALADGKSFDGPTLFLRGERSKYISKSDEVEILRLFPKAKLETLAGARHWVHADAPEQFIKLILEFL